MTHAFLPPTINAEETHVSAQLHAAYTGDVDEQAALLTGWNQRYEQISAGSFQGSVTALQLGPIQVLQEITNQALHQTGELLPGRLAVGMPRGLQGSAMFCNHACSEAHAIVFSGATPFEFATPSGLEMLDVVIDEACLSAFFTAQEHEVLMAQLAQPHLRTVSAHDRARLPVLLGDVQQLLTQEPTAAQDPARVADMVHDLSAAIASVLHGGLSPEPDSSISYQRRAKIVQQARDRVVASGADSSLTVEDLCRDLAVSRRALQYSFQEVLGLSPQSYLRAVRLNGARRAIKQGSSVSDAAVAWGFWHFGRFAQDYKALFGELPSQTCKRFR